MDFDVMELFLSRDNILKHKEYSDTLLCKHSVMEKSIPKITGATPAQIYRMRLSYETKIEVLKNLINHLSHITYFNSFSKNDSFCPEIKRQFLSENDFCYRALEYAKGIDYGFMYVFKDKKGKISFASSCNALAYISFIPVLAVDVCEHAYFCDYGYEKTEYLKSAIARLNISKLVSE